MENELSRLVDALPGLVWTALPDGHVDFLNQRWCEYTGLSLDQAYGWGWQTAVHPEDLPELLERWRSILASGEPREMEARLRRFDGEYRWFLFRTSPLADASGQVVKWCGVNTDIEDQRRAEEALHQGDFRSLADGIPALIALMTPAGAVESVNRHALEYFGAALEELKGWAATDTVHPDDLPAVIAAWTRAVDTGEPYDIEHRIRRADGIYRWFHVSGLPLRNAEGRVVRWCVQQTDIDDQKRAEALLAGEKRLLEMVVGGHSLPGILDALCELVESAAHGCYCSVVLVDPSGTRLEHGAAPSLPASFTTSIIGRPVNVDSGPCAMAAYLNEQVIAADLKSETRWAACEWCPMALAHGLQACWSTPISSTAGKVLGAFAIYYAQPRTPTPQHQALIDQFAHIASIAIERERSQMSLTRTLDELKNSEGRLRTIIEAIPGLLWSTAPDGSVDFLNQRWCDYTGVSMENAGGSGWAATLHPEDTARLLDHWRSLLESGQPGEFEARFRRFDGMFRWFLIRAVPLRDEAGHLVKWYGQNTDIEDRKQAETLLAGEKRFLEMLADGCSLTLVLETLCELVEATAGDCHCRILLADPNRTHLQHGAAPSLPASLTEGVDDRPLNLDSFPCAAAAILNEQVICADLASETRWGAWRPLALSHGLRAAWATPISSKSGKVLGTFTFLHREPKTPTQLDQNLIERFTQLAGIAIERTRAEEAMRESEARKAAMLDSALDCIVTIDHEGCITEFNPAAERTFGYRRDEVIGKRLADIIIPPSLREQHRRGLARYLATEEASVLGRRIELTAVRANGSEFPVELAITRIPLDGPPSFTGYLRDITERKRSEEELRRSEAYLSEAEKLSLTGSFGWNVSTDEHFWSDETFRIFEYDPSTKVTLQLILDRAHPEDIPLIKQAMALGTDGRDIDYESRFLMPGGGVKHLHIVAHGNRDKDGQLEYIGAVQDVTQRQLSEEALGKVRSELAHVARVTSLGALTASIAHEVNQPLSGIITNASTCLRMLAADPPNVDGARETARRTIRDGNRASDVITRLRALFGKKGATTEPVDLNLATREVIALSSNELQRSRVILRAELAGDLPPVTGDRVQLQQVILNLLLNASEAMSGVDDRPRQLVIRTEREEGDRVRLTVQDTGVGIDPQNLEGLFDAFYTTKSGGMGMGLSVCRSIIESHHGRLWAAANDGPGATFSFSIPRGLEGMTGPHRLGAIRTPAVTDAAQVMRNP